MNRREFIGGATAATLLAGCGTDRAVRSLAGFTPPKVGDIRSVLLHLGTNMWTDRAFTEIPEFTRKHDPTVTLEDIRNVDYHRFDEGCWRELTGLMAKRGLNQLVVDIGEGMVLPSHPELAVRGAWSPDRMREEIVRLNKLVYDTVQEQNRGAENRMTVVSSGHIGRTVRQQAENLNRVIDSGTDALILITNRLDPDREGDDVWIRNAEELLSKLPDNIPLGLYECPAPYKRLMTPRILQWCKDTGRFTYMKDTCCDAAEMKVRTALLDGSAFGLYNANCQTLLETLRNGAAGYCGIMANFHPKLYSWLCAHYNEHTEAVERVQALLCTCGFIESGLAYPLTAKYHMNLEGIPTVVRSGNRFVGELTEYGRDCVRQMRLLTKATERDLGL